MRSPEKHFTDEEFVGYVIDDLSTEDGLVAEPIADVIAPADLADPNTAEQDEVWTPNFDTDDDLGGLLSASSPLLARAFRGAERPRESPGAS